MNHDLKIFLPTIVHSKFRKLKRRNFPRSGRTERQLITRSNLINRRGADREKKWKLRGWETDYSDDDGEYNNHGDVC